MAEKGKITVDEQQIFAVDADPSGGGGITAPLGSLAMVDDGSAPFYKSGAGDTAWTQVGAGGGSTSLLSFTPDNTDSYHGFNEGSGNILDLHPTNGNDLTATGGTYNGTSVTFDGSGAAEFWTGPAGYFTNSGDFSIYVWMEFNGFVAGVERGLGLSDGSMAAASNWKFALRTASATNLLTAQFSDGTTTWLLDTGVAPTVGSKVLICITYQDGGAGASTGKIRWTEDGITWNSATNAAINSLPAVPTFALRSDPEPTSRTDADYYAMRGLEGHVLSDDEMQEIWNLGSEVFWKGPSDNYGSDGDYYVDENTGEQYRKDSGDWTSLGAGGAAMVLLATAQANNSASVEFTTGITSAYDEYLLVGTNVVPVSDQVSLYLRVSEDGGATFKSGAADYKWATHLFNTIGDASFGDASDSEITFPGTTTASQTLSNVVSEPLSFSMRLTTPALNGVQKLVYGQYSHVRADGVVQGGSSTAAYQGTTNPIDALQFSMSSGNISTGEFRLYGFKKL